jgi:virginiamycin B lyase
MFRHQRTECRPRPCSFRPALEGLEERQLLSFTQFPLAPGSGPWGITTGADSRIWFTEEQTDKIARVNADNSITEFQVPTPNSDPLWITKGPDGKIWFTEWVGNRVGRVNANGTITEFQIPTANSGPDEITAGPDGNVWFAEANGLKLARVNPNGSITEFNVPNSGNLGPRGITTGPDGNIWFTFGTNGVGRLNGDGSVTEYHTAYNYSGTQGITTGPDGHIWFTEYLAGGIGRVNADGSISEFGLPGEGADSSVSGPQAIVVGPDGNLWITDTDTGRLLRVNLAQNDADITFTAFNIPTPNGAPRGITSGADGKLWFTEQLGNSVDSFSIPRRWIFPPIPWINEIFTQAGAQQAASAQNAENPPVNVLTNNVDALLTGGFSSRIQAAVDSVTAHVAQSTTSGAEFLEISLGDVLISG